jgi:hypothetical protein
MMSPFTVPPVNVYRGDDLEFPLYVFREQGEVMNLAGWEWACQWRVTPDATEFLELAVDSAEAVEGLIRIAATEEQTVAMGRSGVWDLEGRREVDGDVEVKTFLRGRTVWSEDVTRNV